MVRRRRSGEQLRAAVLAAAEAEFAASGYAGATTAAIARRAETTEAQLFRYFPTKGALFRAAMVEPLGAHFQRFMARTMAPDAGGGALERQAGDYIAELQDFISKHERMFLSLVAAEAYPAGDVEGLDGIDALHDYFARGAATMQARTGGDAKIAPELMVRVSFATVLSCAIFRDWLFPPELASGDALRGAVVRFVLDGLYAGRERAE